MRDNPYDTDLTDEQFALLDPLLPKPKHTGRPPPDLREVHLGEWEGGSFRKHVADGHPLALKMRAEQRWDVIPGAEPADQADSMSTRRRRASSCSGT